MYGLPTVLVAFSLFSGTAQEKDRIDELFQSWQKAGDTVRTLVVEFTAEENDLVFKQKRKSRGTVRFLRAADGKIYASYTLRVRGDKARSFQGLLRDNDVYELRENKSALKWTKSRREMHRLLVGINPLLMLLDRKYTDTNCRLKITKQDKHYTYLGINLKPVNQTTDQWLRMDFDEGRVVLMNKESKAIPRHMPRQLWYGNDIREYTYNIQSWRVNAADGPKLSEFSAPEDRPGWQVYEWRKLFTGSPTR